MPDVTDAALAALQDADYVTEFQEGSNSAKRLDPKQLLELYELENKIARDAARAQNGIFRIIK